MMNFDLAVLRAHIRMQEKYGPTEKILSATKTTTNWPAMEIIEAIESEVAAMRVKQQGGNR